MRRFIFAFMAMMLLASTSFGWLAAGGHLAAYQALAHAGASVAMGENAAPDTVPDIADLSGLCCDRDAAKARHGVSHCNADCSVPLPEFGFVFPRSASGTVRVEIETAGPTVPDTVFRPPIG